MQEKISALLDDELDQSEQQEVLRRISQDTELTATWQRYHLIGAAVRDESVVHIASFSERLEPRLAGEQERVVPLRRTVSVNLKRWAPTLAIAASVFAVALLGLFVAASVQDPPGTNVRTEVAQIEQIERNTRWETSTPELEHALNTFLVEHGEFSELSGMNGLTAYAKFVSYDASR